MNDREILDKYKFPTCRPDCRQCKSTAESLRQYEARHRGPDTHYRFKNVYPESLKITPNGGAITVEFTEYE